MFSCHLHPLVGRIFFCCFEMFCFVCIVLPFVNISLIFLLSPVLSGLFISSSCIVFFSCFAFSFLSLHIPVSILLFRMGRLVKTIIGWVFLSGIIPVKSQVESS